MAARFCEGLIEKAMGGGYQHTKLLLDLCELAAKEPQQSDESSQMSSFAMRCLIIYGCGRPSEMDDRARMSDI